MNDASDQPMPREQTPGHACAPAAQAQESLNTQPTRILIVVSNLEYGGAQRQIVELVNNLDASRYAVHIASLSDYVPLATQIAQDIPVHVIKKQSRFDFTTVFKLRTLISRLDIQIVHSYLFDAEIAARLAALLSFRGIKVIGGERNTDYTLKKVQLFAYWLTKHLFDLIVANSHNGAAFNQRYLNQPPHKYRVVYNGVNTERFKPVPQAAARDAIGIDTNVQLIGVFASFKTQKNHPFLFSAVLPLLDDYPNLRLALVGDVLYAGMHGSDTYHTGIMNTINETALKDRCILLGNRDDVEAIYPACTFTVLPSLFEGTPNAVLESMACGVPAIATRVSDNDKIVTPDTGIIVEVGDEPALTAALRRLLDDAAATAAMGAAARQRISDHFSSARLAENTARIYDELVSPAAS